MSQNIDVNLYDRMIRTYGMESVIKMNTSSVLIYGLDKGLGTEIGKNLALGGIKNIYLFDEHNITNNDLETGYYYTLSDVNNKRSDVLKPKLMELNPHINVTCVDNYRCNQAVTILINMTTDIVMEVNNYCRENNLKMVALWSHSLYGTIFVDANVNHIIMDATGENIENVQIGSITSAGLVTCAANNSHNYMTGDTVHFTNLQGTNLEHLEKEFVITVINKTTFSINNFPVVTDMTFINGTAVHIKKQVIISHNIFNPRELEAIYQELNLDKYHELEFMPVVSIMGSFAASEAIKLITNKYMPANQWFTWSDMSLLPTKESEDWDDYKSDYCRMWGFEVYKKLHESKWLLVGAGAIGCEHLKNLAFMGVKDIIITDPDTIEKSNLNRQFLFRNTMIGKPKSVMAAEAITNLRPIMNIVPKLDKVGPDNMTFTDSILTGNITGVFNALDNIKARKFMDEMCFKYNKPLFESGTTGTKGNTQVVIPFLTETYSASSDPDQEKSFPICTIKSFPNEIQHTIHHAMDSFEFFNRAPSNMNRYINDRKYVDSLSEIERNQAVEDINTLSNLVCWQSCVMFALDNFTENYYNNIMQLITTFPQDHMVGGQKFWSAGKRCPVPIKFDYNNSTHVEYVKVTTLLLLNMCNIKNGFTDEELSYLIKNYVPKEFVPNNITIATTDKELSEMKPTEIRLNVTNNITSNNTFVPQEFEKDDDTNYHVKWITCASNLRAMNYSITPVSCSETKGIAGRIIPAIATTTSIVSGLIMLEMLKYIIGTNNIEKYRSTFINLADPLLVYSEPMPANMIEVGGVKVNEWTKFDYTMNSTLREFKQYYSEMFKTDISMIVIGTAMVYAEFLGDDNLDKTLSQVIFDTIGKYENNVSFTLAGDVDIPTITVKLQVTNYK
jgi:ubiquitin-activating enzyme E1